MEKYKFENNKAVVDQPSIITISSTSVSIEHAGSTDTTSIPDDANLTIQIGNIESYNPTSLPSEPAPEITPQQPSGDNEEPSDNPTNPQNPGDDNPTPSTETGYLILHNTSNEDIYITGHIYLAVYTPDRTDYGPLNIDINPVSEGYARYKILAGTTAKVPIGSKVNITVDSKEPDEIPSKYEGGDTIPSIYCRVYSWTDAHDPAVIMAQCVSPKFYQNGPIEFNLTGIKHDEGNITITSDVEVLS